MKKNLKKQIQETLANKSIEQILNHDPAPSSERYLLSTLQILKTVNKKFANDFFAEYTGLLLEKNTPVLDYKLVLLLYKRYLRYPGIVEELVRFLRQMKGMEMNERIWHTIIYNLSYGPDGINSLRTKLYLISSLYNLKVLKGKDQESEMIEVIFDIRCPKYLFELKGDKLDRAIAMQYKTLLSWAKLIHNHTPDFNKKLMTCRKMISRYFVSPIHLGKIGVKFNCFTRSLSAFMPYDFMFQCDAKLLMMVFEVYKVRPDLFRKKWRSDSLQRGAGIMDVVFSKFVVSDYFLSRWPGLNEEEEVWFKKTLLGENIRNMDVLPMKITRKAAHIFRTEKNTVGLNVKQGLMVSQLKANGVNDSFARKVVMNIRSFEHAAFWGKTMTTLYKKQLPEDLLSDVMLYIQYRSLIQNKGVDWRKKELSNLLYEANHWHEYIDAMRRSGKEKFSFQSSDIPKQLFQDQEDCYMIQQLCSQADLIVEGEVLNHCVAGYKNDCLTNIKQIYSLRRNIQDRWVPKITIEVREGKVVQARGKSNRATTETEKRLIQTWMKNNELSCGLSWAA